MARKSKKSIIKLDTPRIISAVFIVSTLVALVAVVIAVQYQTFVISSAKGPIANIDSCKNLATEIARSSNKACGDKQFNHVADLNLDGTVDQLDKEIFDKHSGDTAWCNSAITNVADYCAIDLGLDLGPACGELFHKLVVGLNSTCGEPLYSDIPNLDDDQYVSISDFSHLAANSDNEEYCQAQLDSTVKSCEVSNNPNPNSCEQLYSEIFDHLNTRCGDEGYSEIGDVDNDGVVSVLDFNIYLSNSEDQAWCQAEFESPIITCS